LGLLKVGKWEFVMAEEMVYLRVDETDFLTVVVMAVDLVVWTVEMKDDQLENNLVVMMEVQLDPL
jgi:hypothetical protein